MGVGIAVFLLLSLLAATSPGHFIAITSPSPQPGGVFGNFGETIDSANGLLVIGSPDQLVNGMADAGAAYLYDARNGLLIRTLVSPDPQRSGFFGTSVEIAGNTLVVGAFGETVPGIFAAGRVYVFDSATGSLVKTLTISNATSFGFGEKIEEADGLLAIGSNDIVHGIPEAGRVYVYNATDYSLVRTLISPNVQLGGQFGTGLEVADGLIAVGANLEQVDGVDSVGRAYVFKASTGALISSIVPPNTNTGFFGGVLALADGILYVSGLTRVNGLVAAGAVYVFDPVTAVLQITLTSPNVEQRGFFGSSIERIDNLIIVGAQGETVNGVPSAGRVYILNARIGSLMRTLVDPTTTTGILGSSFGFTVDSSEGRIFVGAPSETVGGQPFVGSVLIFSG